jgi:hypothetical protein
LRSQTRSRHSPSRDILSASKGRSSPCIPVATLRPPPWMSSRFDSTRAARAPMLANPVREALANRAGTCQSTPRPQRVGARDDRPICLCLRESHPSDGGRA